MRTFLGPIRSTNFPSGELLKNCATPMAENTAPEIKAIFSALLGSMPFTQTVIIGEMAVTEMAYKKDAADKATKLENSGKWDFKFLKVCFSTSGFGT